ncbi:hypothetical protein ACH3XW_29585 [Acanthocheilonema viteae]
MRYWAVVFLLTFESVNVISQTLVISGKLSRKTDDQKMQIFLDELKICKQRGKKMKAIITDNQSVTVIQNSSLHSSTNLTNSIIDLNIILKDIFVPNNHCEGMVLDASLNYIDVKILLLCYGNNQIVGWNNSGKSDNSIMNGGILNFLNYIHELIYLLHPSYLMDRNRKIDKTSTVRYHFISNEIKREEKAQRRNEKFWIQIVILLVLIIAFICFILIIIQGIHWLCRKKKSICNIHGEQMLLPSLLNGEKSNLLITETTNDPYHVNKSYHIK